jgi:tetratricopeptide (TPR) repeat protein
MRRPGIIRRSRPAVDAVIAAALASGVAILINVATSEPIAVWPWVGVVILTVLVGLASWRSQYRGNAAENLSGDGIANALARAQEMWAHGEWSKAEAEYRAVLKVRHRVLGDEHPDTLRLRSILADILRFRGEWAEAESECRMALSRQRRVLGEEHPDTLRSQINLASVLRNRSRSAEAETEYRAALEAQRRLLGDEHSDS